MRVVVFCHSLKSCWNHGNAHFLRGLVRHMLLREWEVQVYEPADGWSAANMRLDRGYSQVEAYRDYYPELDSVEFNEETLDLDEALTGADLVLVHEWNSPELVRRIGEHRAQADGYSLYFHDTHHRSITAPDEMERFCLQHYNGVLAFGEVVRQTYLQNGWATRAWTWHEAADETIFKPLPKPARLSGDLVWIGNWGDDERTAELHEFLIEPVRELGLKATVYGVRYPEHARKALASAGIDYRGWTPNYRAPEIFSEYRFTVHVPRRPYSERLVGVPTIRMFEALACGIPLISAPWNDAEGLFDGDADYARVKTGEEMISAMRSILERPDTAQARASHGLGSVLRRHTCKHRVDELLQIEAEVKKVPAGDFT